MKKGFADRLLLAIAPRLASGVIRMLHLLLRTETLGEDPLRKLWERKENVIIASWHDQLLMLVNAYRGPGARILISRSKDGELIARTLQRFGHDAVRGSSSRGGRGAFRTLVNLAKEPYDLAITPDGPKGPRHQVKDGLLQLARLTGRPIVPATFACSNGHRFNSWDKFLLPYPWGRGVYLYGEPLYYQQNETVDSFRARVQESLDANNRAACEYLKQYDYLPV